MNRRDFLRATTAAGLAGALSRSLQGAERPMTFQGKLPRRKIGNTDIMASLCGMGGVVAMREKPERVRELVAEAMDLGVNYFDIAPTYGNAEELMGPVLQPHRDKIVIACKTQKRDRKGAAEELRQSLKTLKTDRFDVYQMHAITDVEKDVKRAMQDDGAIRAFEDAKKEGLVRYLGFSAHSVEAATAALDAFDFDTVLYPVNCVCHHEGNFVEPVLEKAGEKGAGVIAIKAVAKAPWPKGTPKEDKLPKAWYQAFTEDERMRLCLKWTLSRPGVAATVPSGNVDLFLRTIKMATDLGEPTKEELATIEAMAQGKDPLFAFPRG